MIPIRDNIPSRRFPVLNVSLIVTNVLVFIYELSLNQYQLTSFVSAYGVIPRRLTAMLAGQGELMTGVVSLFTAMFLHGGWFHLLGNMLYLWIFGDNVEDRLGRGRYLLVYLATGIGGSLAQVWINPLASEPIIGASGAIAGVLGAYFISFPRAKILTLFPIIFFITFVEIPAFVFLIIWFFTQSLNGLANIGVPGDMVAWWAHIGGFVTGVVLMKLLAPERREQYLDGE